MACILIQQLSCDNFEMMECILIQQLHSEKVSKFLQFVGCGNSWIGLWSYQLKWFQWTGSQKFSLIQMKWVDAWDTNEVMIQSNQTHGLNIWRLLEYYVYPNSTSILELGTRVYPYKNINLVLIEMFNLISSMNATVKIRLAKTSTHYFDHYNGIINNMNSVSFEPYDTSIKNNSSSEYGRLLF